MEAYMRNKFKFYGIKAQARKALAAPFLRKDKRPSLEELKSVILELWNDPHRELQFIAMELFDKYKKELTLEYFQLVEKMIYQA
jgi:3-methyladenine DNA glycosylase AlkD